MNLTLKDIINEGNLIKGKLTTVLDNFSIDTRKITQNGVFIGIKGEKIDGGIYYKEALKKGVKGCILNKNIEVDKNVLDAYPDSFILLVDDTIVTLQTLAKLKRKMYNIPVVAITGSVGKTSTKDLVASVLEQKYKVLKTEGNLNNHLGLPLTILKLHDEDCLVLEMGMNNLGEISLLSKIACPTIGIITNIGTAHIGNLGSRENILKAKLEILEGMVDKKLIINNDNDLLHKWYLENNQELEILTYGINNASDVKAYELIKDVDKSEYKFNYQSHSYEIIVPTPGEAFILNSLAALSIGLYFHIDIEKIKKGILNYQLSNNRMEVKKVKGYTIINDCYNASYDSMISALDYLGTFKNTKIAVLGDMLELGEFSTKLHKALGKYILKNKIDYLITIGKYAREIGEKALKLGINKSNVFAYSSNEEAINKLKSILKKDDVILIKASHGMNFLEIYKALSEE